VTEKLWRIIFSRMMCTLVLVGILAMPFSAQVFGAEDNAVSVKNTIGTGQNITVRSFYSAATTGIVEVTSVETGRGNNETWRPYYYFFHDENMSVKVTATNNAANPKTATIHVGLIDDINQTFGTHNQNFTFSAGETRSIYFLIYIPKWALSGSGCRATSTAKNLPEGSYCSEKTDNFQLLSIEPIHDLALVGLSFSAPEAYVGWKVNITLTIENKGNVSETSTVECKYELEGVDYNLGNATVTDLCPDANTTQSFTLKVTERATYVVEAQIEPVFNETNTADNAMASQTPVKVKMLGDVNGDDKVDMQDIIQIVSAFGSRPLGPRWNAQADMNQDDGIDAKDVVMSILHFGLR
jgi:hypothetical protein